MLVNGIASLPTSLFRRSSALRRSLNGAASVAVELRESSHPFFSSCGSARWAASRAAALARLRRRRRIQKKQRRIRHRPARAPTTPIATLMPVLAPVTGAGAAAAVVLTAGKAVVGVDVVDVLRVLDVLVCEDVVDVSDVEDCVVGSGVDVDSTEVLDASVDVGVADVVLGGARVDAMVVELSLLSSLVVVGAGFLVDLAWVVVDPSLVVLPPPKKLLILSNTPRRRSSLSGERFRHNSERNSGSCFISPWP